MPLEVEYYHILLGTMSIQEEPTSDSDNEDKREDRLHHETGQSSELDNQNTDVEVNFFFFFHFFASFFNDAILYFLFFALGKCCFDFADTTPLFNPWKII